MSRAERLLFPGQMTALDDSDLPFHLAMRQLMELRDVSFRRLAIDTGRYRTPAYSVAQLHKMAAGERPPTVEGIEVVARALDTDPRYFREYREHVAMEAARRIMRDAGLDAVLDALADLERDDGGRDAA